MRLAPPRSTPFPYTTLFRSGGSAKAEPARADLLLGLPRDHSPAPGRRERDGGRRAHGDLPVEEPRGGARAGGPCAQCRPRSEEHTSELQSLRHLVCRLLLEK